MFHFKHVYSIEENTKCKYSIAKQAAATKLSSLGVLLLDCCVGSYKKKRVNINYTNENENIRSNASQLSQTRKSDKEVDL